MSNKQMYEEIFKENVNSIYRYSFVKLGVKEQAEDIVSETFTKMLEQDEFENIEKPKYWLITVARNLIYQKYKKRSKETSMNTIEEQSGQEFEDESSGEIDKEIINEQTKNIVKSGLEDLDDITKEIITLKIWEDYKFEEIAEMVGENINSVKSKYYRGLEELKRSFNKKSKGHRIFAVGSVPLMVAILNDLATGVQFTIADASKNLILTSLLANLAMEATTTAATTTAAATTAGSNALLTFLGTTTGKAVAVATTVGVLTVGGGTSYVVYDNVIRNETLEAITCEYNENTYNIGDNFDSIDGCNSCSCAEDGSVMCTEMSCDLGLEEDDEIEWVEYSDSERNFTIDYPSDWEKEIISESITGFDSDDTFINFEKGEYKFTLHFYPEGVGFGGVVCQFDDSTSTQIPGPGLDKLGARYEIDRSYSRNQIPITSLDQYGYSRNEMDYNFRICRNGGTRDFYADGRDAYFGVGVMNQIDEVLYYTPTENIDTEMLEIMDQIFLSYETLSTSEDNSAEECSGLGEDWSRQDYVSNGQTVWSFCLPEDSIVAQNQNGLHEGYLSVDLRWANKDLNITNSYPIFGEDGIPNTLDEFVQWDTNKGNYLGNGDPSAFSNIEVDGVDIRVVKEAGIEEDGRFKMLVRAYIWKHGDKNPAMMIFKNEDNTNSHYDFSDSVLRTLEFN